MKLFFGAVVAFGLIKALLDELAPDPRNDVRHGMFVAGVGVIGLICVWVWP